MAINLKKSAAATSSNGINVRGSGGAINFRIGPPPPFTPLSLPGLSAWYKAEAATVNESLVVTLWPDSSGSDNSLTSISGSPSLNLADAEFNNMSTISFNGSSYLANNSPIGTPQGSADFSGYVVGYANNTGGEQSMFGWGTNSFAARVNFWAVTSPNPDDYYEMEFSNATGHPAVTTMASPVILSFSIAAGDTIPNGLHYRNNVLTSPTATASALNIGTSQIAAGTLPGAAGLNNLNGKLAEMLVYNARHTNSERLQVTQYLAAKYGISI